MKAKKDSVHESENSVAPADFNGMFLRHMKSDLHIQSREVPGGRIYRDFVGF